MLERNTPLFYRQLFTLCARRGERLTGMLAAGATIAAAAVAGLVYVRRKRLKSARSHPTPIVVDLLAESSQQHCHRPAHARSATSQS